MGVKVLGGETMLPEQWLSPMPHAVFSQRHRARIIAPVRQDVVLVVVAYLSVVKEKTSSPAEDAVPVSVCPSPCPFRQAPYALCTTLSTRNEDWELPG